MPSKKQPGREGFSVWKAVVGPRLTIALLGLLMALGLVAIVVPQEPTSGVVLGRYFTPETLYLLRKLRLTDVFRSPFFAGVLVLLGSSLLLATASRLREAWRQARERPEALDMAHAFTARGEGRMLGVSFDTVVSPQQFRELVEKFCAGETGKQRLVRSQESDGKTPGEMQFFAQSGRFAGLWRALSSFSAIALMIAGFAGSRIGYEGQVVLDEGQKASPGLGFELEALRVEPAPPRTSLRLTAPGGATQTRQVNLNESVVVDGRRIAQAEVFAIPGAEKPRTLDLQVEDREAPEGSPEAVQQLKNLELEHPYALEGATFTLVDLIPEKSEREEGMGARVQVEYREGEGSAQRFWLFQRHPSYDALHRKLSRYVFVFEGARAAYRTRLRISRHPELPWILGAGALLALSVAASSFFPFRRYWFSLRTAPDRKSAKLVVAGWSPAMSSFEPLFRMEMTRFRELLSELDEKPRSGALEVKNGSA